MNYLFTSKAPLVWEVLSQGGAPMLAAGVYMVDGHGRYEFKATPTLNQYQIIAQPPSPPITDGTHDVMLSPKTEFLQ